jgi:glycosyltransferase involved in cell wall biosynthesis
MISVIAPSYNYGHLIAATIEYVQAQTYTDWEMIIIDDGSDDNTEMVVKKFIENDPRISFYKQKNAGPSAARNLGLSKAKGEFIQFIDADDLIQSQKFEQQLGFLLEKPEVDVVYGNVRYFTNNPEDSSGWMYSFWGAKKEWMPKISGQGKDFLVLALKGSFAHINSFLFRKSIIDKAGLWDEKKRAAEDYLFVLDCVLAGGRFEYADLPGTLDLVRWHASNASHKVKWIREQEKLMRIELMPRIEATGYAPAIEMNTMAIKALELMIRDSWKAKLLSGGPFDFLKKALRFLGLEKRFRKLFYK